MADIQKYFGGYEFWDHLSTEEKNALERCAVYRNYPRGSMVFDSGSECLGLTYVIKGGIRTYMMSDEGKEVTLFKITAGECCVLSASCVIKKLSFDSYMTAEADSEVLIINAGAVSELSEGNIYFRCFLYELAAERFSAAMKTMDTLLFLKLEGRLAKFLLDEFERTGLKELRMTHEQIAQNINSAREVVARTLKRFSQEGLVDAGRGVIKLLDIKGLRSYL